MTIRTRLTFLYSTLLAIVILMFSAVTSSILNWTLRNQVDESLLEVLGDVRSYAVITLLNPTQDNSAQGAVPMPQPNSLSTPGLFVQIWLHDEQSQRPFLQWASLSLMGVGYTDSLDPEALDSPHEVRRDVVVDNVHLRVATIPLNVNGQMVGHIQAGSSLHTVDAAIDRLLEIMLIAGAGTILIALFAGDFVARRALRPIDAISQTARQITAADDLSRRIPYDGPPDEIGQLVETFNDTLGRLERLFKVQRRFVADVSHEMRTPLTAIQGNLDLMRRIGHDEEAMEAIQSESQRMTRLVDDLLLLAKADAGRLSLEKTMVELDTLVLEVYNQARVLSDGVEVILGPVDQVQVVGDSDRLKQLLLNLVTNGLKYTPDGGTVTLSLNRSDDWATINVADTGLGIPEDDLPYIFDRFYRVDKARSRVQGGTGLGLSIARWIADAHGGEIGVTSTQGKGSTFTLRLPLVPVQVAKESIRKTHLNLPTVRLPGSR
ncbi:MAG: HAMP domain-containing protein [Anaerolineae bacterium]|nr:HAMP domain-containing protein [Anaerolineae bacterium]